MFENLSEKLQRAFKNLRGQGTISEENIGEALREIRVALLEADVNLNVVKKDLSFWEVYGKVTFTVTDQFAVGASVYYVHNSSSSPQPTLSFYDLAAKKVM